MEPTATSQANPIPERWKNEHLVCGIGFRTCIEELGRAEAQLRQKQEEIDLRVEQGHALNQDKEIFKAQLRQEREAHQEQHRAAKQLAQSVCNLDEKLAGANTIIDKLRRNLDASVGRDMEMDDKVEALQGRIAQLQTTISTLTAALARVEAWDLPTTGRKWDDGTPVSYGAAYGSNGERDYVRSIARTALANITQKPEEEAKP